MTKYEQQQAENWLTRVHYEAYSRAEYCNRVALDADVQGRFQDARNARLRYQEYLQIVRVTRSIMDELNIRYREC